MAVPGVTRDRLKLTAKAIRENPYIPIVPTIKQLEWLAAPQREKGYGGAAGGGKSIAVLAECLLPVKNRGYSALILRKTFPELALPGAIMDVAKQWLMPHPDVTWNERDKKFTFTRHGSTVQFGFLEQDSHKFRYHSAEFQRIAFDEATAFAWPTYSYLRSRARRRVSVAVLPKVVSATNPGNIGHQWYYQWFVKGDQRERAFVQALLSDNPHLDPEEYKAMLKDLTEIQRLQLLGGKWVLDETGKPFKFSWWDDQNRYVPGLTYLDVYSRYIFIDSAIKDKQHNAYNAIVVLDFLLSGKVRVAHAWREHTTLPGLADQITDAAYDFNRDGKLAGIIIEDRANGASVYQTLMQAADPMVYSKLQLFAPPGSKEEKWHQAGLWCKLGCVLLPYATEKIAGWLFPFEEEIYAVPEAEFKDQADAFSLGIIFLEHLISRGYHSRVARGEVPAQVDQQASAATGGLS